MRITAKPFLALTAEDLMSPVVITIPQSMSLPGAARLMRRAAISGAPVVDAEGRCVGVISATDFVSWAVQCDWSAKRQAAAPACFHSPWQIPEAEALPNDEVGRFMTVDAVTTGPETPIGELARIMVDAHIHRIIVVDAPGRPIGVVSSTDVLAAVTRLAQQQRAEVG
jgi:CBS-domain-containing membrane protein